MAPVPQSGRAGGKHHLQSYVRPSACYGLRIDCRHKSIRVKNACTGALTLLQPRGSIGEDHIPDAEHPLRLVGSDIERFS